MRILPLALIAAFAATPALAADADKIAAKVDKHLAMADTNKDGSISEAEFNAEGKDKFAKKDANGDKMISRQEMIDYKTKEWKEK